MNQLDKIRLTLSTYFTKCIRGYHIIHNEPIKEANWEDINAQVLIASGCNVESQSNGSHRPGADIICSLGGFSNKSAQYSPGNRSFKISSYRLTTVCSDKDPGNIETILTEINKRKNFEFYSIIVRGEKELDIKYDWYLIPADHPSLDPSQYIWTQKIGKTGKNKGISTGWQTNIIDGSSMSITFSMSSQLWMDIMVTEDMQKYLISSAIATKGSTYNYIQLYDMFSTT
jgi:hypothetical protein